MSQTKFVPVAKMSMSRGLEFSAEFSAPSRFSGGLSEKNMCTSRARTSNLRIIPTQYKQHRPDFLAVTFLAWGIVKTLWAAYKCSGIDNRIFCPK
jgi:hypothetical protein